jgi:hypothetical protein
MQQVPPVVRQYHTTVMVTVGPCNINNCVVLSKSLQIKRCVTQLPIEKSVCFYYGIFTVWSQRIVIICIHKLQQYYSESHNFTEHHDMLLNCNLKIIRYASFTSRITPVFTVSHMRLHEVT